MEDKEKCAEAVALGKRNKGKTKQITDTERAARAERMAYAREFRLKAIYRLREERHPIRREAGR